MKYYYNWTFIIVLESHKDVTKKNGSSLLGLIPIHHEFWQDFKFHKPQ